MKVWMFLAAAALILIYDKVWRARKCKRKIEKYVYNKGGNILSIEKISPYKEIYSVIYLLHDERMSETVKFSFFYNEDWY